jgi:hypothetical protein
MKHVINCRISTQDAILQPQDLKVHVFCYYIEEVCKKDNGRVAALLSDLCNCNLVMKMF